MHLQLSVRQRLAADQRQFELGLGQEEQVLARVVNTPESLVARPWLLDAKRRRGQLGTVDTLQDERFQPVVASGQLEG